MDTHVKVVAVLHIALGVVWLLVAMLLIVVFGGAATLAGLSGDPDAALAVPFLGVVGSILVLIMMTLSLPGIIIGAGLWLFQPWARIAGIVLSILDLLAVPFGTILGVYGLWVLFNERTELLFRSAPSVGTAPTAT
jgi:hypothetical protein